MRRTTKAGTHSVRLRWLQGFTSGRRIPAANFSEYDAAEWDLGEPAAKRRVIAR
jgi:hypothetical protein